MKVVGGIAFALLFIHLFVFPYYRLYILRKLLDFIEKFYLNKTILFEDYNNFMSTYTGRFRLYAPFPDELDYPDLYKNKDFEKFHEKFRVRNRYFRIAIIVLLILMFITVK